MHTAILTIHVCRMGTPQNKATTHQESEGQTHQKNTGKAHTKHTHTQQARERKATKRYAQSQPLPPQTQHGMAKTAPTEEGVNTRTTDAGTDPSNATKAKLPPLHPPHTPCTFITTEKSMV